MDSEPISDRVDGLVHEETQVSDRGVDLTLAAVSEIETSGLIDFGGGELEPATLAPIEPQRRHPDDDYGWWNLDDGQYVIEHNESVTAGLPLLCETRPAVRERGAFHPTVSMPPTGRLPLTVGGAGVQLKENARISTLRTG